MKFNFLSTKEEKILQLSFTTKIPSVQAEQSALKTKNAKIVWNYFLRVKKGPIKGFEKLLMWDQDLKFERKAYSLFKKYKHKNFKHFLRIIRHMAINEIVKNNKRICKI